MEKRAFDYLDKIGKQPARVLSEYSSKHITALLKDLTGAVIKDMAQTLEVFREHYQALSKAELINGKEFLGVVAPHLTEEDVAYLDQPIASEEIAEAIRSMKYDSAPELDGYTMEYYKKFEKNLISHLCSLFQTCIGKEDLLESWKKAKVILLPKQRGDLSLPEAYRPISLLNVDYKILATVLTTRLKNILGSYIHHDQGGFMKGRQLHDCNRKLSNIIDFVQSHKIPAVLYLAMPTKHLTGYIGDFCRHRCIN